MLKKAAFFLFAFGLGSSQAFARFDTEACLAACADSFEQCLLSGMSTTRCDLRAERCQQNCYR